MKFLITGGAGFVGRHVITELKARRHDVVALVRKPGAIFGVQEIVGDITKPETLVPEQLSGCQAVIHLVGIIREFPRKGITFRGVHLAGTQNLIAACKQAGIQRYLHMSAQGRGNNSQAQYQCTKAEAEELVRRSGLNWTIFRPSVILGAEGEFTQMLSRMVRLRIVPLIGAGASWLAPVTVTTVAQAFVEALEAEQSLGKTYEINGDLLTYRELVERVAGNWNVRILVVPIPKPLLSALAALFDHFSCFPLTREQLIMLAENQPAQDYSIYAELGLNYQNIDQALAAAFPANK